MNMNIRILNNILADQVQNKIISSHQTMCCVSLACSDVSTFAFHKCDTSILQLKNKAIWLSKYMQRKYVIQYNILSSSQKLVNTEWRKGWKRMKGWGKCDDQIYGMSQICSLYYWKKEEKDWLQLPVHNLIPYSSLPISHKLKKERIKSSWAQRAFSTHWQRNAPRFRKTVSHRFRRLDCPWGYKC